MTQIVGNILLVLELVAGAGFLVLAPYAAYTELFGIEDGKKLLKKLIIRVSHRLLIVVWFACFLVAGVADLIRRYILGLL